MIFFDPLGILIFMIGAALSGFAQMKVKSAYAKWSQVGVRSRMTGAELAQRMMFQEGIDDVGLETTPGELTDHYDPRSKTVRLSQNVYYGNSVAALGIAAHEVGHVIQHARGYAPLHMRTAIYPLAGLGSNLGIFLAFIGLIMGGAGAALGGTILWAGIYLFAAAVAFTLITLPVEFDASGRALKALANGGVMADDEVQGARSVLNAAALTYVAAAAVAVMQLLHLVLIAMGSRD